MNLIDYFNIRGDRGQTDKTLTQDLLLKRTRFTLEFISDWYIFVYFFSSPQAGVWLQQGRRSFPPWLHTDHPGQPERLTGALCPVVHKQHPVETDPQGQHRHHRLLLRTHHPRRRQGVLGRNPRQGRKHRRPWPDRIRRHHQGSSIRAYKSSRGFRRS